MAYIEKFSQLFPLAKLSEFRDVVFRTRSYGAIIYFNQDYVVKIVERNKADVLQEDVLIGFSYQPTGNDSMLEDFLKERLIRHE